MKKRLKLWLSPLYCPFNLKSISINLYSQCQKIKNIPLQLKSSHDWLQVSTRVLLRLIRRTQMLLYSFRSITCNTLNYYISLLCQQYHHLIVILWYLSPKYSILGINLFLAYGIVLLLIHSMEMLYQDDCKGVYKLIFRHINILLNHPSSHILSQSMAIFPPALIHTSYW